MSETKLTPSEIRVYEYLDELRESGIINMFDAREFIEKEFGVDRKEASRLLLGWMENFSG